VKLSLSFPEFCARFGVGLFPHQAEDFGEATARDGEQFRYRLVGISWPRGDGKSFAAAAVGAWVLACSREPVHVLSVALDIEGSRVILGHAKKLVRGHPTLDRAISIRADSLIRRDNNARWTIASREHEASRGQHPNLILYDETGWAKDDELFGSLLAAQASIEAPLMLITSTVGRTRTGPLWSTKILADGGDPSVLWRWHGENRSPRVTKAFLERQRRILLPAQYAREHQNLWFDGADSFTNAADVDAAMARDWTQQTSGAPGLSYVFFLDLGSVHDATVLAIGHRDGDSIFIDSLDTLRGDHAHPVDMMRVEELIRERARQFRPSKIRVESWQGIAVAQALARRGGLPVEVFTPTAKSNAEEWPLLAQALATRSLVLFPHAALREELLNLKYEIGPTGAKVTDKGRIHQDHAVATRGVTATLARRGAILSAEDIETLWRPPRAQSSFDAALRRMSSPL
jgi:phage terminase large subunit-like protein